MTDKQDSAQNVDSVRRALLFVFGAGIVSVGVGAPATAFANDASPETIESQSEALKKLLAQFARAPGISAHFDEEKKIALLKTPLRSSGNVYFHPPFSLARILEKPRPSHLVVKGDQIVIKEEGVRRQLDLSDKPALRALVGSLLNVLSGDREKLLADYKMELTGRAEGKWSLVLSPKNADLKNFVRSFTFEGKGLVLSQLLVVESSGDQTLTRFSGVDTARKFTPAEVARFFEI